jgi:membrane protein YqaA with SNARE-associated domain
LELWLQSLLVWLALPTVGLPAIFVISLLSATLIPMGSEPAVFGYVKLNPEMLWPTVAVASVGNTIGGLIDYWLGAGAKAAADRREHGRRDALHSLKAGSGLATPGGIADAPSQVAGAAPAPAGVKDDRAHRKALSWLERFGPKAMLLAWLPLVGDPLCVVAGWLRLPFWPSAGYMLLGKFLRYATYTPLMLWMFPDAI